MNKDLHNMDEIFNSAYRSFSEDPSSNVWDKISSGLDKEDVSSYKRRLRRWKQVAILSLFLLGSLVVYETILKNNPAHSNKNAPFATSINKSVETSRQPDKSITEVQSPRAFRGDVSTQAVISKASRDNSLTDFFRVDNSGQYHQQAAVITPLSDATETNQDGYPLFGNTISSTSEKNYSYKTASMKTDHVEVTFLNIVPKLPGKNNSERGQLFNPEWTVSAYISSDRPGYRLDKDGPVMSKIKEHEDHQPSYSAGILIARQFKKRLAVQTGLMYSNTTIVISPQQIYASPNQTGNVLYKYVVSSGYAYVKPSFVSAASPGDSLTAQAGEHVLQHIAVPLMLKYDLIKNNKWIVSPGLGVTGNFLVSAKVDTDLEGSANREHVSIRKLDGIRPFNWSLMGAVTLEYMISRRMSLNVRPFFTYAMSPITSTNDVETLPYNIGVGAGASYRF